MPAQRQRFSIGTLIFLLLFGGVFAYAGILVVNTGKIDASWQRVSGTIVDVSSYISKGSTIYTAIVEYHVGDQAYKVTSNFGSSMYPAKGGTREVAYNPAQPQEAKVVESGAAGLLPYIFPIVGIAVALFAIIFFIKSLKRESEIKRLMQSGQKVQGVLVDVQVANSSNSRRSSYKLVVAATDFSGTVRNYVSDSISGIAAIAMEDFRTTPIPMDVYIDSANPSSYYVDVSGVPELTAASIIDLLKKAAASKSVNG